MSTVGGGGNAAHPPLRTNYGKKPLHCIAQTDKNFNCMWRVCKNKMIQYIQLIYKMPKISSGQTENSSMVAGSPASARTIDPVYLVS